MSQPILFQDWVSLEGRGSSNFVEFTQSREKWLWAGDASAVTLNIEVRELDPIYPSSPPDPVNNPAILIETASAEHGPWTCVMELIDKGNLTQTLRRDGGVLEGFLRWSVREGGVGRDWFVCFRITAVIEPV